MTDVTCDVCGSIVDGAGCPKCRPAGKPRRWGPILLLAAIGLAVVGWAWSERQARLRMLAEQSRRPDGFYRVSGMRPPDPTPPARTRPMPLTRAAESAIYDATWLPDGPQFKVGESGSQGAIALRVCTIPKGPAVLLVVPFAGGRGNPGGRSWIAVVRALGQNDPTPAFYDLAVELTDGTIWAPSEVYPSAAFDERRCDVRIGEIATTDLVRIARSARVFPHANSPHYELSPIERQAVAELAMLVADPNRPVPDPNRRRK